MKNNLLKYFNLNRVSKNDINNQYIDLSILIRFAGYGHHIQNIKNSIIYESVNYTTNANDLIKELKVLFDFKDWQIVIHSEANNVELILLYADINDNFQIIEETMNSYGWTLGVSENVSLYDKKWKAMSFELMFEDNITNEVKSCKYIFHWTPLYNKDIIEKDGLLPKESNRIFKYLKRLHVLRGDTPFNEIIHIGKMLCKNNMNPLNNGKYILYGILTKDLPNNIIFYYDPRYDWGFITKNSICANLLQEILIYDFNNDKSL
jgi:hypothetical protein